MPLDPISSQLPPPPEENGHVLIGTLGASPRRPGHLLRLTIVLCVSVAFASGISHFCVHWLKIKATPVTFRIFGANDRQPVAFLEGSSLAIDGLDWDGIANGLKMGIELWGVAGSSPCEWEILQQRSPYTRRAFIVVSPYDLNEYWLCDFRSDIVPFRQTVHDLRLCRADWAFSKRIISQYPLTTIRTVFPSAGRSDGVMVGVRAKLQRLAGGSASVDAGEAPRFGAAGASVVRERLSEWSPARLDRRLALFRAGCQGRHAFDGLKKLALIRLLQRAEKQGPITLIVVPVSPIYHKEFLPANVMREFEETILDVQVRCPHVHLVRLDQTPALNANDKFYDLVHLNTYGQKIATTEFINDLNRSSNLP